MHNVFEQAQRADSHTTWRVLKQKIFRRERLSQHIQDKGIWNMQGFAIPPCTGLFSQGCTGLWGEQALLSVMIHHGCETLSVSLNETMRPPCPHKQTAVITMVIVVAP